MNNTEQLSNQGKDTPKKANLIKTLATAWLITVAWAINGQNSRVAEPQYYKTPQTALAIPQVSEYYLYVKWGESMYITIAGMDANSWDFFKWTSPQREVNTNTLQLIPTDPGNRLVKYNSGWVAKSMTLHIDWNARLYANNKPAETTRGNKASAGPNMASYKWAQLGNSFPFVGSASDSIKTGQIGETRMVRTNDGNGYSTNDTITFQGNAVIDGKNKLINIPSIVWEKYIIAEPGTINWTDTTWTPVPGLQYNGNGSTISIQVPNRGKYNIWTQRVGSNNIEYNCPVSVDFTNDTPEVVNEETTSFRQQNRELFRDTEVPSILYSIDGREIGTGLTNHVTIPSAAPAGTYIIKYTENKKIKTKKIIIK